MLKLLHFCVLIFQNDVSLRFIRWKIDFLKYTTAYKVSAYFIINKDCKFNSVYSYQISNYFICCSVLCKTHLYVKLRHLILKILGNLVVHLKMITVLKERTFAVQKATIVGKITQIYCNYKDKKNHNLLIILLLTSKFLKFLLGYIEEEKYFFHLNFVIYIW